MRSSIRAFALLMLVVTVTFWMWMGGTLGWTKTSVEIKKIDPVTEIEFVEYEDRLVPGIELLAVGVCGAVILFAITLIHIPTHKKNP